MSSKKDKGKLRIAMIGLRGIPAKSGGVEHVVENLSPLLVKLGAEVTVYCRTPYCKERPRDWKGVRLRYLPTINTKHFEAIMHTVLCTLDSLFRKYDIVHYHAMGNSLLSFAPRFFGKKTVVTLHGLDYEREKWGLVASIYLKICERLITMFPNRVISVSKKIKEHYLKEFKKEVEFIPNGVEVHGSRKLSALKKHLLQREGYILFLSRIVPEKGVHFLVEAFRKVDTDQKLVIVGDTTHTEKYLEELLELSKGDSRIIFTGPLYGNDKYEAFSNASLFVLPSTIEGMPIVLLEAMSFGLCPLVSDIRENMDVIEDRYGFSFRSRDVSDLKKQLESLMASPELRKKTGASARDMVMKRYRWEAVAEETFALYKDIAKKKVKPK
jgi:glycosyltransferase involved in cell wall biosynthesis